MLSHTLRAFESCEDIAEVILVAHPERLEEYREMAAGPSGCRKVRAVVPGGETRQRSVEAGLAAVSPEASVVAIHDGARPLVTPGTISAAVNGLVGDGRLDGVVVGHPVYDTLKQADAGRTICGTVDRSELWVAQTPQVFRASALRSAFEAADREGFEGTDDASVVERWGGRVGLVLGPRDNIKVTVEEDLVTASALLAARGARRS
jgi:2-C-methyl-D-erythritol 4-phosphate cytidylyltransferase